MNPLASFLGGNKGNNIMMRAAAAMLSGEKPQDFLNNLAKSEPQLQGMDFSNLEQAARDLCQQKGVDFNTAIEQTKKQIPKS